MSEMNLDQIREHWKKWATDFGTDIRATTKTSTAKEIELGNLIRILDRLIKNNTGIINVLEAGCGNGHNLFMLAKSFPNVNFDGFDYIEEMITNSNKTKSKMNLQNIDFFYGDLLEPAKSDSKYDIIFTVRALINLNSDELQGAAIANLSHKLKQNGHLVILENTVNNFAKQNKARNRVGLPSRKPSEFNHFINENYLESAFLDNGLTLIEKIDFMGLHDLILYVLLPKINGGVIDYDSPLVLAATELTLNMSQSENQHFENFGQNRMFICQKI